MEGSESFFVEKNLRNFNYASSKICVIAPTFHVDFQSFIFKYQNFVGVYGGVRARDVCVGVWGMCMGGVWVCVWMGCVGVCFIK